MVDGLLPLLRSRIGSSFCHRRTRSHGTVACESSRTATSLSGRCKAHRRRCTGRRDCYVGGHLKCLGGSSQFFSQFGFGLTHQCAHPEVILCQASEQLAAKLRHKILDVLLSRVREKRMGKIRVSRVHDGSSNATHEKEIDAVPTVLKSSVPIRSTDSSSYPTTPNAADRPLQWIHRGIRS